MKSDSQKLEEIRDVVSWATPPLVPTDEEQHWNEGMFDGLRKIKKILNESPSNQECPRCGNLTCVLAGKFVCAPIPKKDLRPKKNNTKECKPNYSSSDNRMCLTHCPKKEERCTCCLDDICERCVEEYFRRARKTNPTKKGEPKLPSVKIGTLADQYLPPGNYAGKSGEPWILGILDYLDEQHEADK